MHVLMHLSCTHNCAVCAEHAVLCAGVPYLVTTGVLLARVLKQCVAAGLTQPQRKSSMQLPDSLRPAPLQSPYSALVSPAAGATSYANGCHGSGTLDREHTNGDIAHHSAATNGHSGGCLRCVGGQQGGPCGACGTCSSAPALSGRSSSGDEQPACRAASCRDEACSAGALTNGAHGAPVLS